MKCTKCGDQIPSDSSYCPGCGTYINAGDQPQPQLAENEPPAGEMPSVDISANPTPPPVDFEPDVKMPPQTGQAEQAPPVYNPQQQGSEPGWPTPANPNPLSYNAAAAGVQYDIQNKRKRPAIWIAVAAIIVVMVTAGIVLIYNMMTSGAHALYRILDKSQAAYTEELNALVDNNPVLSQIKTLGQDSFTLTTEMDQAIFKVNHDLDANILDFEMQYPMTDLMSARDLDARLYLTDSSVILGAENVLYAESSYDELSEQLSAFSIKNNLDLDQDMIDAIAESASSYQNGSAQETSFKDYYDLFKNFLSAVEFSETSDVIMIGGERQICDRYDLLYTGNDLAGWIKNELIPWVQERDDAVTASLMYLSEVEDKSELIEELEEMADSVYTDLEMTLSFLVYEDIIVGVEYDDYDDNAFSLSATGEDYRLNHIEFSVYDGYDKTSLTLSGNQIGSSYIESELAYSNSYSTGSLQFIWDTEKQTDNFTVQEKDSDDSYTFTFTANDGEMLISFGDLYYYGLDTVVNLRLTPLETPIQLPESTIPLSELDLEDFTSYFYSDTEGFTVT